MKYIFILKNNQKSTAKLHDQLTKKLYDQGKEKEKPEDNGQDKGKSRSDIANS